MIKLIFLLLNFCSLTFAYAANPSSQVQLLRDDPYHLTISKLSANDKTCTLHLSNESIWNAPFPEIAEGGGSWQIGDSVEIVFPSSSSIGLINRSQQTICPIHYSKENTLQNRVCITAQENKEGGGGLLLLSDGSHWNLGSWSKLWSLDWQVGDHLIITRHHAVVFESTHTLINLDRGLKTANVRLLSKEGVTFLPLDYPEKTNAYKKEVFSLTFDNHSALCTLCDGSVWSIKESKDLRFKKGQSVLAERYNGNLFFDNKKAYQKLEVENSLPPSLSIKIDRLDLKRGVLFTSDGSMWLIFAKEKATDKVLSIAQGDDLTIILSTKPPYLAHYVIYDHTQKLSFNAYLVKSLPKKS